ncbi:hypothetical protein BJF89_01225 [Corynebacterium sp. CNJ-954]|nr:hypothetical protein BJF89_01225 [Corynebacterium sp. CNJ-954]
MTLPERSVSDKDQTTDAKPWYKTLLPWSLMGGILVVAGAAYVGYIMFTSMTEGEAIRACQNKIDSTVTVAEDASWSDVDVEKRDGDLWVIQGKTEITDKNNEQRSIRYQCKLTEHLEMTSTPTITNVD